MPFEPKYYPVDPSVFRQPRAFERSEDALPALTCRYRQEMLAVYFAKKEGHRAYLKQFTDQNIYFESICRRTALYFVLSESGEHYDFACFTFGKKIAFADQELREIKQLINDKVRTALNFPYPLL